MDASIENRNYNGPDIAGAPLEKGVYEGCTFNSCDFSNADLSGLRFIDCTFTGCNISLARLDGASFREVGFTDCKMLGMHFDKCGGFGQSFRFERCTLNHSSFYKAKISHTVFRNTQLKEVDFTESDLTSAVVAGCDIEGALFDRTILVNADLRTSFNYAIDPEKNYLKKAKFSLSEIDGLLTKYPIIIDKLS